MRTRVLSSELTYETPGLVVRACNSSDGEMETDRQEIDRGLLASQCGLLGKFQASERLSEK